MERHDTSDLLMMMPDERPESPIKIVSMTMNQSKLVDDKGKSEGFLIEIESVKDDSSSSSHHFFPKITIEVAEPQPDPKSNDFEYKRDLRGHQKRTQEEFKHEIIDKGLPN